MSKRVPRLSPGGRWAGYHMKCNTPEKERNEVDHGYAFLRRRRSLKRKKAYRAKKYRLHASHVVKCSYHTLTFNGGKHEALHTFYHRRKKKSTAIFGGRTQFPKDRRSSRKKSILHQPGSQQEQSEIQTSQQTGQSLSVQLLASRKSVYTPQA